MPQRDSTRVWRSGELVGVDQALTSAEQRVPVVLSVEGGVGMGKSAVLMATAARARGRGFHVAIATASREEAPFGLVRQLVAQLPQAGRELDVAPHVLLSRLHRAGGGAPICLVADDLHQADADSLRWLNQLTDRLGRLALCLITSRLTVVYPAHPLLLAELDITARRVRLDGLGRAEVARLLGVDPDHDLVTGCLAATGGNPLVLGHLRAALAALDQPVVEEADVTALGEALLARIEHCPGRLADVVRAVAVLGAHRLDAVAAALGVEPPVVLDCVRQLVGVGLLNDTGFAQPLVRRAVAGVVDPASAEVLRVAAVRHLREVGAPDRELADLAVPTRAMLGPGVVEVLRRAAETAVADDDSGAAVAYLTRALDEPNKPDVHADLLLRLGRAEMYLDPVRAARHLAEAVECHQDPVAVLDAACQLSQVLYLDARYGEAREALARAVEKAGDVVSGEVRTRVLLALRLSGPHRPEDDERPVTTSWRGRRTGGRAVAALVAELSSTTGVDLALGREAAVVALSGGAGPMLHDPQRLVGAIDSLLRMDEFDLALRRCDEVVLDADRRGLDLLGALGRTMRSRAHRHRGDLAAAERDARHALATIRGKGLSTTHFGYVYATEALVQALLGAGDLDRASAAAEPIGLTGPLPDTWQHACFLHARGQLRMRLGDAEGALADQLDCGRRFTAWAGDNPAPRSWRANAARAHLELGQLSEARALAREGLDLARRWQVPSTTARALLTVAAVEDGPEALRMLIEAESVLRGSPSRLLYAQVLLELARTRLRHGAAESARQDLARAETVAQECGAEAVLAALVELRGSAGEFPVSSGKAVPLPASLTPHEFRVAQLVASGRSNDETALKLSVSRRAVEFHLTNIYRKLGVQRRTQLAAALAAHFC